MVRRRDDGRVDPFFLRRARKLVERCVGWAEDVLGIFCFGERGLTMVSVDVLGLHVLCCKSCAVKSCTARFVVQVWDCKSCTCILSVTREGGGEGLFFRGPKLLPTSPSDEHVALFLVFCPCLSC